MPWYPRTGPSQIFETTSWQTFSYSISGVDGACGAHILSRWGTLLCHKNINLGLTVGSNGMVGSSSDELSISLCFWSRGSAGKGEEARNGKNLHILRNYQTLPTMLVELMSPC